MSGFIDVMKDVPGAASTLGITVAADLLRRAQQSPSPCLRRRPAPAPCLRPCSRRSPDELGRNPHPRVPLAQRGRQQRLDRAVRPHLRSGPIGRGSFFAARAACSMTIASTDHGQDDGADEHRGRGVSARPWVAARIAPERGSTKPGRCPTTRPAIVQMDATPTATATAAQERHGHERGVRFGPRRVTADIRSAPGGSSSARR